MVAQSAPATIQNVITLLGRLKAVIPPTRNSCEAISNTRFQHAAVLDVAITEHSHGHACDSHLAEEIP